MIIREAKVKDAEKFLKMLYTLDTETKNMLFEEGERKGNIQSMQERIQNSSGENGLTLIIDDNNEIGGFLSADRGHVNRIRHSAYIVIGMLKKYRGKQIGTRMFEKLDLWARKNNISRLELTAVSTNESAIHLYKKMGFKIEGLKEKSMIVDGKYVDEYYMAKII